MDYYLQIYNFLQRLSRSKFVFGLEILLSAIFGITLVFPFLGVLLVLNELLRFCFKVYLWIAYEGSVKISDDEIGTNYMRISPTERNTVLYLGELEGTVDVETIREKYQKHVIENKKYEKMTYIFERKLQYICMRKDPNFDIKNHIRYYPGTEERTVTENELMKEILPNLSRPFEDKEKPEWEEVIIPYYQKPPPTSTNKKVSDDDENKTISLRIIRMHHCYMDGACTLIMIANTFSGEGKSFPYVIDPCKPLKISKTSMFLYKLTCLALFSSISIRQLLFPPFLRASRFAVHRKTKGEILFGWTNKIHMDIFKSIKDKSGVSMPAIVSTVLSGAIRKLEIKYPFTQGKGELIDKPIKVPDSHQMWLVAGMFPYTPDKPTNEHIVIETQVNTADISNLERLAIMNDDLGRLAKNPFVTVYYWFGKLIGRTPHFIANIFLSLTSCPAILSNIPLCTRNFKMWGRECYSIVGWVPLLANSGLGVVSVRYGDHFRYCIQVDSSVVNQEQLDYLISQIEQQVEDLMSATAQLNRKISTETSVFDHGKAKKQVKKPSKLVAESGDIVAEIFENEDMEDVSDSCINNNIINGKQNVYKIGRSIMSKNYSFIYKLKDSLEQIRHGIRKLKEE